MTCFNISWIYRVLLIAGISFFHITTLDAQTYRQYLKAGEAAFEDKNYFAALRHYQEALDIESKSFDAWYKLAESARFLDAHVLADTAYMKVIEQEGVSKYPDVQLNRALIKRKIGKYEAAKSLLEGYLSDGNDKKDPLKVALAQSELKAVEWAIERQKSPATGIEIERLENDFNTPYSEFGASVQDGKLIYSSLNFVNPNDNFNIPRKYSKLLVGDKDKKTNETWMEVNDSMRHTANAAFSPDGALMVYSICDFRGSTQIICELFERVKDENGKWSAPKRLPDYINQKGYTATEPTIGFDQRTEQTRLYFTSDRPEGSGKLDVYFAVRNDTTYSKPVNLKVINTKEDDITPFFYGPKQELFFSSNGRQNLGGYDIYSIKRTDTGWDTVAHLPPPINTSYDDVHYWLNDIGSEGLLSSNRPGSLFLEEDLEACCYDLYKIRVTEYTLTVNIFDAPFEQPLDSSIVKLYEIIDGEEVLIDTRVATSETSFDFPVEAGKNYKIVAEREGYVTTIGELDLTGDLSETPLKIERDLFLPPLQLKLDVLTFEKTSGKALNEVRVQLFLNDENLATDINEQSNDFHYDVKRDLTYKILGFKPGYHSDSMMIDLKALKNPIPLLKKLYLQEKDIREFPPLYLFFDNDEPNPKTRKTTTEKVYSETFDAYYARMPEFIKQYTDVLKGRDKFIAEQRMKAFFEREVRNSYESMEVFNRKLLEFLNDGQTIEVTIRGYTSPRAGTDYNEALASRRIHSLMNHFKQYSNAGLVPFIESGQLRIVELPYGERFVPEGVSDRLKDERNSIYSVAASAERRVEIVGIRIE